MKPYESRQKGEKEEPEIIHNESQSYWFYVLMELQKKQAASIGVFTRNRFDAMRK